MSGHCTPAYFRHSVIARPNSADQRRPTHHYSCQFAPYAVVFHKLSIFQPNFDYFFFMRSYYFSGDFVPITLTENHKNCMTKCVTVCHSVAKRIFQRISTLSLRVDLQCCCKLYANFYFPLFAGNENFVYICCMHMYVCVYCIYLATKMCCHHCNWFIRLLNFAHMFVLLHFDWLLLFSCAN